MKREMEDEASTTVGPRSEVLYSLWGVIPSSSFVRRKQGWNGNPERVEFLNAASRGKRRLPFV